MNRNWAWLSQTALEEVKALIGALPRDVRIKAQCLAVLLKKRPRKALLDTGIEADTLGLFEGHTIRDDEANMPMPPQIVLFLDNLWDATKPDKKLYRKEIRITYLHELGHYLGLEEDDMEARSLD
jgi:predicted Zn-dependent protease with MMP-like domain